jgi:hypothetical protein
MSDALDPYRQWLGISASGRPLDHYALLGLAACENDRDRIYNQALAQMGRILEADPGLHSPDARRIFDELEAARDCLCHPQKKQLYDAQLSERPVAEAAPEPIPPTAEPAAASAVDPSRPEPFDPYQEWLGITDPQRPPNHYALLGLDLYEDDRQKIDEVSMLLMARVLEHDPGPHCELARRLFDELDAARNCLGDSQQKHDYDAKLRERRTGKPAAVAELGDSASVRRKSWGNLSPRGSSVLHADSDHRSSAAAVDSPSDSSIARRIQAPKPPEEPEVAPSSPFRLDERYSRLAGWISGGVLVLLIGGYFLFREPPERDPLPGLLSQLSDPDPQQRIAAAQEFRKLGPRSSDALPQLVQVLSSDGDEKVRLAVAQAVREAGPNTVVYSRDFEIIKMKELNPGVLQILNELTGR